MSPGEITIIVLMLIAFGIAVWVWRTPAQPPTPQLTPLPMTRQIVPSRQERVRAVSRAATVRCILKDEDECTVLYEIRIPRHQRRLQMTHEGQSFSAASGSNDVGFVYRRVTH